MDFSNMIKDAMSNGAGEMAIDISLVRKIVAELIEAKNVLEDEAKEFLKDVDAKTVDGKIKAKDIYDLVEKYKSFDITAIAGKIMPLLASGMFN